MSRWEPNGRGRLVQAAIALYAERGFDNTTVAEIAQRAGVTERTFFRHFTDKREALFAGASEQQEIIVRAVASAPNFLAPLDVVGVGLEVAGEQLEEIREPARLRGAIVAANQELRERELAKFAELSEALTEAFRGRGLSDSRARLTAEVAISVFKVVSKQWVEDTRGHTFVQFVREAIDQLKAVAAGA